jgi:MATE family multidrug resistance protein
MSEAAHREASEVREMVRLAVPLILAELGWMAMGVVDTMIVGRLGAASIGAVGLGTMLFYGTAVCSSGLLLGMDTLVARAWGARDLSDARRSFVSGIWIAVLLAPVIMMMVRMCVPLLAVWGIDPMVRAETEPYLQALSWSTAPLLLYFALRRYLQAVDSVKPVTIALVTANVVNAVVCWALVFGELGLPRMGTAGAGYATCISRLYMAGFLVVAAWRQLRGGPALDWRPDFHRMGALLRLGIPAAGQILVEVGVFATVTVLVGKLNAVALAGHQIALTTVSTTFMMPLGISSAAAVRVGHALGRGDTAGAARSGWTAVGFGAAVMSAAALMLLVVPQWIARLFTPDAVVIASAAVLLRIAAFFQLFDGLQIVTTGALRGAGNTHTPMIWHFVGYWILGLPLGASLAFWRGLGAAGLWAGLSVGLILIGTVLTLIWRKTARSLPRQAVPVTASA